MESVVCGSYLRQPSPTRLPVKRNLPKDIVTPCFGDLADLAILRILDAAIGSANRPPRLFPTSEGIFGHSFLPSDWATHGNLETELSRMEYMLLKFPERGVPAVMAPFVCQVLSHTSVLTAWKKALPVIQKLAEEQVEWIAERMAKQRHSCKPKLQKSDFITIPLGYQTDADSSTLAITLWIESLSEIVDNVEKGNLQHARHFLEIFAFLKDPLGGLADVTPKALDLFVWMLAMVARSLRSTNKEWRPETNWRAALAQAAQEALFLACPLLEDVAYVHFTGHQQLPYVYVLLDELPRSEFATPERVLYILEEILASSSSTSSDGACLTAPIAVSAYRCTSAQGNRRGRGPGSPVIIDGNHRASAAMLLRLVAEKGGAIDAQNFSLMLDAFCNEHHLHAKWRVDLQDPLCLLVNSPRYPVLLRRYGDAIRKFRHVEHIPALVVREDHFFTACQQRPPLHDRPILLLPIHQGLFNDNNLGFAFPQAGQVHGRPLGFRPMPFVSMACPNNRI